MNIVQNTYRNRKIRKNVQVSIRANEKETDNEFIDANTRTTIFKINLQTIADPFKALPVRKIICTKIKALHQQIFLLLIV